MNKKVIIIGVVILILGGVVFYFASQKTTPTTNKSVNQNVVLTQKLSTGGDIKIIGTVVENVTEYISYGGPAYLNVRTDDGTQTRVIYYIKNVSPGEAECKNMDMASTGFSVKAGAQVEVYAEAISQNELFTCDSTTYYIKTLTTTSGQQNSGSNQTQSVALALDFFAGGSIFGSSFEVKIASAHITYRETTQGGAKEANKIERSLLPVELDDIRKTISDAGLITLQSQDFTKEPLVPDQASYRITVSLDGKENKINCGIPPSGTESTTKCQKQIDKLRLKLNSILGVNIY
ncbi:MAG: hypothetical protein A3A28_01830 [Candidatus Sungbacteria bacterium RIFCSPLOWO2_01_FULL_47_32]|nr:MAG: hypothetical protein A3A28_01830 [Candidatus Sungbacteria bacterium RIFCSPLOWO2_01_FULL_47_32]